MTATEETTVVGNEPAGTRPLRVGDRVQVRSQEEILATLDERGELDSLPFMPEMLPFCGQTLTVEKVAHKACDTITRGGLRKMDDAVHLDRGSAATGRRTAAARTAVSSTGRTSGSNGRASPRARPSRHRG